MKKLKQLSVIFLTLLFCLPVFASDWQLNRERSAITYLSSKQATLDTAMLFESNLFGEFSGSIDGSKVQLFIELDSLDTRVPIRDERVAEHVFLSKQYPQAVVAAEIADLAELDYVRRAVAATLTMRGQTHPLQADVIIERSDPNTLRIQTATPVLVDANAYGMFDGFATLKELVGLMQIPMTIPVSLNLVFESE